MTAANLDKLRSIAKASAELNAAAHLAGELFAKRVKAAQKERR